MNAKNCRVPLVTSLGSSAAAKLLPLLPAKSKSGTVAVQVIEAIATATDRNKTAHRMFEIIVRSAFGI